MKAKIFYVVLALALVFSLTAVAIVPAEPAQADPSWWNTDWEYRQKLTFVQDAGQSGALTDFPVMVRITSSDTNFWSHVRDDGFDVRFLDSDDFTEFDFHFEKFDHVTDLMIAWVEVPSIAAYGTTDYIWLYYGNLSAIADPQNQSGTYDANFMMVQHLEETSGTHYDSTANNNDGTPQGGVSQNAMGKINGADDFDGTDDYIDLGDIIKNPSAITVEVWYKIDALPNAHKAMVNKGDHSYALKINYGLGKGGVYEDNKIEFFIWDTDWREVYSDDVSPTGTFTYAVGTWDGTNLKLYIDSTLQNDSITATDINPTTDALQFGNNSGEPERLFDGILDEVRISNTARSADWIKAQYLSMTDNFITYGSEEEAPPPEEEDGDGCFIATAAYGTSTAGEIDTLRAFRDEVLLQNSLGSQLVTLYYEVSPPVADFISEHGGLRTLVRELLVDPVAWLVEATGTLWRD